METSEFMKLSESERKQRLLEWQIRIAYLMTLGTGEAITWEDFIARESWRWDSDERRRRFDELSKGG